MGVRRILRRAFSSWAAAALAAGPGDPMALPFDPSWIEGEAWLFFLTGLGDEDPLWAPDVAAEAWAWLSRRGSGRL